MSCGGTWIERLERQRSLIAMISTRIEERASAGEPVELSLQMLEQEKRLYRRMLGRSPLRSLERHADTPVEDGQV